MVSEGEEEEEVDKWMKDRWIIKRRVLCTLKGGFETSYWKIKCSLFSAIRFFLLFHPVSVPHPPPPPFQVHLSK